MGKSWFFSEHSLVFTVKQLLFHEVNFQSCVAYLLWENYGIEYHMTQIN